MKAKDVGTLQPGKQYQLSHDPIPTPQSILDGSYATAIENLHKHRDVVIIVPRLSKYCGSPSLPSITFSVNGQLGPRVLDLVQDRVVVDQAFDLIFWDRLWKQTSLTIDVGFFLLCLLDSDLERLFLVAWCQHAGRVYTLCRQGQP